MNFFYAVYKKNKRINRRAYPISLFVSILTGGIFNVLFPLFVYKFVFNGNVNVEFAEATGTSDYITYITLGSAMNVLAVTILLNVGRAMINEIREGTLEPFLLSPASRTGYFVGCFIEQTGRSMLELLIIIVTGVIFGASFSVGTIQGMSIVLLISFFSFFSMAILLSVIMVYTRETYIIQSTLFITMDFICGVMFPVEFLPVWLQKISILFPLTHVLRLFRNIVILGESAMSNSGLIILLLCQSMLYFVIGIYLFEKLEKKLIEDVLS